MFHPNITAKCNDVTFMMRIFRVTADVTVDRIYAYISSSCRHLNMQDLGHFTTLDSQPIPSRTNCP
jgi:hypothetical protein